MPLVAGSVTVDAEGEVTGTGAALALYLAEEEPAGSLTDPIAGLVAARIVAIYGEKFTPEQIEAWISPFLAPLLTAQLSAGRVATAARATKQAAAVVALVQTATVTTVVPSTPGTFVGVVT